MDVEEEKMNKNLVIVIVLAVLVVVAVVQAVQLGGLKDKVTGGSVATSVNTASAPSSSGGASVPANINELPTMVGGC